MPAHPSSSIPTEVVPSGRGTRRQVLIGPDVGPNFALRKFIMEPGGGMPLHTNEVEHEQYVLGGRARVVIGDEVLEVQKDDVVFIPGRVPHSYEAMGEEPFEFLCVVPNLPDETRLVEEGQAGGAESESGGAESESGGDEPVSLSGEAVEPGDPGEPGEPGSPLVIPEDELGC
jgi:quercetin dioxygenase-like cupin family protein